jgi:hypothetical protein
MPRLWSSWMQTPRSHGAGAARICKVSGPQAKIPDHRVTDEHGTLLFQHLYDGGYPGVPHFRRLRQADKDVHGNSMQLREFHEILIGDPFADAK